MALFIYEALYLFTWLTEREDTVVIDIRNKNEFAKFKVEGPHPFTLLNIPYFDFIEFEKKSIAKLPSDGRIRIVCAKEASAKYVAEIVHKNGFADVGYLRGGINTWGNLLEPRIVARGNDYELYQFIRPGKASCSYGLAAGKEMMLFDPSRKKHIYDIKTIEGFVTFIKANIRPQPDEYAEIRLINANLKQVEDDEQDTLDIGKNECAASAYTELQAA